MKLLTLPTSWMDDWKAKGHPGFVPDLQDALDRSMTANHILIRSSLHATAAARSNHDRISVCM
jgi:hypothetical protein